MKSNGRGQVDPEWLDDQTDTSERLTLEELAERLGIDLSELKGKEEP